MKNRKSITISILLFISLLMYFFGVLFSNDGLELMLFGMAISATIFMLIPYFSRRHYFIFEPASFVFLSVLFGLCFKTFYIVLGYHTNIAVYDGLMRNVTVAELQPGATVLLVGIVAFILGYQTKLPSKSRNGLLSRYQFSRTRVDIFCILFLLASLFSFALFLWAIGYQYSGLESLSVKRFQGDGYTSADRLGQSSYYFYRLSLICKAPMYVLFFLILKNNIPFKSRIGLMFSLCFFMNIFVPFFVSNKAGIVIVVADLIVISYGVRKQFAYFRYIVVTVVSVLLISVVADIRGGDALSDYTFFDRILGSRYFVGLTKTAQIVNAFPDRIDYFYGATLVGWMNIFLPESYSFSVDAFSNLDYFLGLNVFGHINNGIPPGIIAEFYINFGFVGVILGMYCVGMIMFRLHQRLYPKIDYGCVLIIYALVVVRAPTFLFNNGVSVALLKTVSDVVIVLIFLFIVGSFRGGSRSQVRVA